MHEATLSRASTEYREVELPGGTIQYRDQGDGPAIVLVHGLLVNGRIWDRLMPLLCARARCVVPELPLGSHAIPVAEDRDLTPARWRG
jgi:pimeloyl-ACP methyl ester carboxylesterase